MWTSGKQLGSHVCFALVLVFRRFDSDVDEIGGVKELLTTVLWNQVSIKQQIYENDMPNFKEDTEGA